jgi:hypothetical protein
MKDNTILKKFTTQNDSGTYSMNEFNFFFGSKMMDIEDIILIDNSLIPYYQVSSNTIDNQYQYYILDTFKETLFNLDLFNLKYINQNIKLLYNTVWEIDITAKNILIEYLFAKIKNMRVFKSIKSDYFLNKKINSNIYDYINKNILNRYKVDINFYIQYVELLKNDNQYTNKLLKESPVFSNVAKSDINLMKNISINKSTNGVNNIVISFNQTKDSNLHTFYYYYDLIFTKI